ncbi:MAG: hypothetical protein Q7S92_05020 [Candidatus Diapherotrites archaeon]|nr:hypothetical protein [Candidatus Diapherotrites archaeon]
MPDSFIPLAQLLKTPDRDLEPLAVVAKHSQFQLFTALKLFRTGNLNGSIGKGKQRIPSNAELFVLESRLNIIAEDALASVLLWRTNNGRKVLETRVAQDLILFAKSKYPLGFVQKLARHFEHAIEKHEIAVREPDFVDALLRDPRERAIRIGQAHSDRFVAREIAQRSKPRPKPKPRIPKKPKKTNAWSVVRNKFRFKSRPK